MYKYPYIKDISFLKEITKQQLNEYYVKIIILDWQQNPIKQIQNKVISASFSIDGTTSIRRTGNMTFLLQDEKDYYLLSINKKIKIEIGFKNFSNKYIQYNILWFPIGIYIISDLSISNSIDSTNITLQLKDKMCLLNGECGGTLPASTIFDNYETIDQNGNAIIQRPSIYQIIQELVNHFGNEQLGKIIISDLDTRVKQVMKWTGSSPLYFLKKNEYAITTNAQEYLNLLNQGYVNIQGSPFQYGDDVGYVFTDFTYPGELIGNAGQTVVDILQKIKQTLGNYEYFYDLNGNFVFQQIKNYLNNSQSKYILDSLNNRKLLPDYISSLSKDAYFLDLSYGKSSFSLESNIIISYNNNPLYSMIKNDFIIWGIRTNTDGTKIPIRYHLAIDQKPQIGNVYQAFQYLDENDGIIKWHMPIKFTSISNFPQRGAAGVFYMDTSSNKIYQWGLENNIYKYIEINTTIQRVTTKDWRTQLYFQGVTAQPYGTNSNFYYTELLNEWPKIYNIEPDYYQNGEWKNNSNFKADVIKNSSSIDYYLDFLDENKEISNFSINDIGRRSLVLNQNENVNCIFESYIPDIILIDIGGTSKTTYDAKYLRDECIARGQDFYQVPSSIYNNLAVGGSLNSAYQTIRQLIHQYVNYNNNVSLQTLPMFFLEPNTRITIEDNKSNIHGDYIINSLSFSIGTSSSLNINAVKVLEKY